MWMREAEQEDEDVEKDRVALTCHRVNLIAENELDLVLRQP
jgi:hypothetical protein